MAIGQLNASQRVFMKDSSGSARMYQHGGTALGALDADVEQTICPELSQEIFPIQRRYALVVTRPQPNLLPEQPLLTPKCTVGMPTCTPFFHIFSRNMVGLPFMSHQQRRAS